MVIHGEGIWDSGANGCDLAGCLQFFEVRNSSGKLSGTQVRIDSISEIMRSYPVAPLVSRNSGCVGNSGKVTGIRMRTGATSQIMRSYPLAPLVSRSAGCVGSSGKGVWDSGARRCDLVNYGVAPLVSGSSGCVDSSGKGVYHSGANLVS